MTNDLTSNILPIFKALKQPKKLNIKKRLTNKQSRPIYSSLSLKVVLVLLISALLYLASCSQTHSASTVQACLKTLSKEEIEYFQKIAYWDYKQIKKWNKNISVSVEGNDIRDHDQETIDEIIAEVSKLIKPLKIIRTTSNNANLVFKLSSKLPNSNYAYGQANSRFEYFDDSVIDYTEILIFPTSRGYHRKKVMFHEMMHALGLAHPKSENGIGTFYDSRLSPYNLNSYDEAEHDKYLSENYMFSDLDRKIIRTLYSPCIPSGISKDEMETLLESD